MTGTAILFFIAALLNALFNGGRTEAEARRAAAAMARGPEA